MKDGVYAVRDEKLNEFGILVLARNDQTVMRSIKDEITGSGSMMEKYGSDFTLFCVGEFDHASGVIVPLNVPRRVETVSNILQGGADAAQVDRA